MDVERLAENLFRIASGCNVYVVRRGSGAVAIDLGDGRWLAELPRLGVDRLDHVFLTHHHADQCSARSGWRSFPAAAGAVLHAPAGEEAFLEPDGAAHAPTAHLGIGCPPSYSILPDGLTDVRYDMAGFSDIFWEDRRIRFIHTPGHSRAACSVLLDADGRQALFAGDAAHAGAAVWEPWHLEWDHWTGSGALAAWEGIERLRGIAIDFLCPSHGPVVPGPRAAARLLARLSRKLLAWYRCKGSMAGPAHDAYVAPEAAAPSWRQYSPSLFQFGMNGYLLRSRGGRTLAIDPAEADLHALAELLSRLGAPPPSLCTVTHYHADHCDGVPALRRDGARVVLHPWVQEPLRDVRGTKAPWLPHEDLHADEAWPESGAWTWEEFAFQVAPFPGQTLWHCTFAARIDGRLVAFTGDTFQPASRWNGTGGFCAYNRSLFRGGFADSARLLLSWSPDWLAAGHGTVSRFDPARFRAVVRWARRARRATRALCPTGDLESEYYAWGTGEHGRRP